MAEILSQCIPDQTITVVEVNTNSNISLLIDSKYTGIQFLSVLITYEGMPMFNFAWPHLLVEVWAHHVLQTDGRLHGNPIISKAAQ